MPDLPPDPNNQRVDARIGESRPLFDATIERFEDLEVLRAQWEAVEGIPVFVDQRDEGVDHSWGGVDVRTLLRGEQSGGRFSSHSVQLAPGASVPVHYHVDAHTYLLVVDGRVHLQIGDLVERVGKHSVGYAPPRTHVGVENRSGQPAVVALTYSPAGADRAFAAAHQHERMTGTAAADDAHAILARYGFRFDGAPLENDARTNAVEPPVDIAFEGGDDLERIRRAFFARTAVPRLVATNRDEYSPATMDETLRKQLLTGDDSAGTAMMNMVSLAPGPPVDPHHQPTEDEFFFVTEGPAELTCGADTRIVGAGAIAYCPRNCTHGFRNPNPSARMQFVTLNSPAGHERALVALRKALADGMPTDELTALSIAGGWRNHVPYE